MNSKTKGSLLQETRPSTVGDFEIWLESAYTEIESIQLTPVDDEGLFEDVASVVDNAAEFATFFGYPEPIPVRPMRTPIDGKRIIGQLLAWVRVTQVNSLAGVAVEELMSKAEVAKVLRVSQKTVDNERQRGKHPFVKIGIQVRFPRSDVRDYIEASKVK